MTETRTAESLEDTVRRERRLPSPADVAGVGPNLPTACFLRALRLRAARAGGEDAIFSHAILAAQQDPQPAGALRAGHLVDVSSLTTRPVGSNADRALLRKPRRYNRWSPQFRTLLVALILRRGPKQAAAAIGVSYDTMRQRLSAYGISLRKLAWRRVQATRVAR